MPGTTPSCFCRFPDAFVNNDNKKFGPKVAAVKFNYHEHTYEIQNLDEYTQAKPIL